MHGSQRFRVLDGPSQLIGQLLRVVVLVEETVHALGHKPGGAGVLGYDGGLAENQPLGDEGGHGVIPGGTHHAVALLHQGFDLRALQPLAVENGLGVVPYQTVHGAVHSLVGGFAHKEENGFFPYRRGQQPDGIAEDIRALAVLQRAYRHKEGTPPGKADVIAGKLLGGVVRQTVDQLLNGKIRPDGVHGGGGVGAYGADVDIFAQLLRNLVGDEGVARKGIVQPPQHRHEGAVQGVHHRRFHHRVGQHKVCAGGQPPQGAGSNAVRAGDHSGSGFQKQRQRAFVRRPQHHHLKTQAAQHRHGAYQHDGRAGHGQLVA